MHCNSEIQTRRDEFARRDKIQRWKMLHMAMSDKTTTDKTFDEVSDKRYSI